MRFNVESALTQTSSQGTRTTTGATKRCCRLMQVFRCRSDLRIGVVLKLTDAESCAGSRKKTKCLKNQKFQIQTAQ